jgi:ABC-type uncharacterized transport system fused permease/ATPase subunit
MNSSGHRSYGRWAIWLIFVALLILVAVGSYTFVARSSDRAPAAERIVTSEQGFNEARRLGALMILMLVAMLLILLFVIGSYLLIRIGREITRKSEQHKPTKYVDAWSQYRLTDEQIAEATQEPPGRAGDSAEDEGDDERPGPERDGPGRRE